MLTVLSASVGSAFGSVTRFWAQNRFGARAELTILGINWVAAFLAGVLYALPLSTMLNTFLMAGFVGGFSTFSAPIISLADQIKVPKDGMRAIGQVLVLFIGGLILFWIGSHLMHMFVG